jgi:medium-chain acyl-[acyl-carrier-protein] hydrolase
MRPRPKPGAQVRLFCFPFAGGGASAFRTWQANLPPEIEACAVQFPGRENRFREPALTRIRELAAGAAEGLLPYCDMPFAFFGHSLGGMVSFELARLLRRRNEPLPVQMFVSACRAPHLPDPHPPLHGLSQGDFIREVRDRYDSIPAAVVESAELLQLVMPTVRADFEAFETYRYADEAALPLPITCFGGVDDRYATPQELEAWQAQTRGSFRLRLYPGGHFFLQGAERAVLEELAADLKERLAPRGAMAGSGRNQEARET